MMVFDCPHVTAQWTWRYNPVASLAAIKCSTLSLCLFPHKVPIQPWCGAVLLTYDTMTWIWCSIKMAAVCLIWWQPRCISSLSALHYFIWRFCPDDYPIIHSVAVLYLVWQVWLMCSDSEVKFFSFSDWLKRNIGIRGNVFQFFLIG